MRQAIVLLATLLLAAGEARGRDTTTPSVSNGSVPLWTSPDTASKARFSRDVLEDWLCSPEPPGSEPLEPPPPPEDDPNGTEVEIIEVSCDMLDMFLPIDPQQPFEPWRAGTVLETAAGAEALEVRLSRLCLSCERAITLSCGSFGVETRLDPRVEQPWSSMTLLPDGDAAVYLGEITVALEVLFTHVEKGWTARLPRTRTYSGFGHWADTLEGYPPAWDGLIDADCDNVPDTALSPVPASFRPAAGKGAAGNGDGKPVECLFDVEGSGRLCWSSVPGLP